MKRRFSFEAVAPDHWRWDEPAKTSEHGFIELQSSLSIMDTCEFAIAHRAIALIVGAPGYGKTEGLHEYYRRSALRNQRVLLHTTSPYARPGSFADELLRHFERATRGNLSAKLERLRDQLAAYPVPLILDEANHLSIDCLEGLRYLHDQTGVPIVLAGSLRLFRTLSRASDRYFELAQLQSRIRRSLILKPLSDADARQVLARYFRRLEPAVLAAFIDGARGSLRVLFSLIDEVQRVASVNALEAPTAEAVQVASGRLMSVA